MTNPVLQLHKYDAVPSDTLMQCELMARGWTRTMVAKLLGAPDFTRHRDGGGTINYYCFDRVDAAEQTPEFGRLMANSTVHKEAAAKAVVTRIKNMEEFVRSVELTIAGGKSDLEINRLARATHGGNYIGDPGPFHWNNQTARACIRHNLTNYEILWGAVNRGYTGQKAYEILRRRIDALVNKTYPQYAKE